MLSAEQHAFRLTGLGGSDAVTACAGLAGSPWKSRRALYMEKMGDIKQPELGPDEPLPHWGNVLEQTIGEEFARRTSLKIRRDRKSYRHPKIPHMLCHLDFRIQGKRRGVDCKAPSIHSLSKWGESGTDEVPPHVWFQVQHYMCAKNMEMFYVPALFGGHEFRIYEIPRDQEGIDMIIEREAEFWQHVIDCEPPAAEDAADVMLLHPRHRDGETVTATDEVASAIMSLLQCKASAKEIKDLTTEYELTIKDYMGGAEAIVDADGTPLTTWKAHERAFFEAKRLREEKPDIYEQYVKRGTVRPLLLKKPK